MRQLNLNRTEETIIAGIKKYVGDRKTVIGISGGVDSALVAALCTAALGKENVLGIMLPYGEQKDIKDSISLIEWLDISHKTIDIKPTVDQLINSGCSLNKHVKANIMARTRMTILYALANEKNGLVIGTTNASEMAIGYFTKFGDGACDLEPIADLYKTEVWQMARFLNIPDCIVCKKPSAGLCPGQTDEGDFCFSYKDLDAFLQGETVDYRVEIKIRKMIENSNHKRELAPIIRIT